MLKILYKETRKGNNAPPCETIREYSVDGGKTWMPAVGEDSFAEWKKENIIIENIYTGKRSTL
jgi:hypothetical protein